MRLFEFSDAQSHIDLWKLVSESVWKAISVQAQEQERVAQQAQQKQKKMPKSSQPHKTAPKPAQVSKAIKAKIHCANIKQDCQNTTATDQS